MKKVAKTVLLSEGYHFSNNPDFQELFEMNVSNLKTKVLYPWIIKSNFMTRRFLKVISSEKALKMIVNQKFQQIDDNHKVISEGASRLYSKQDMDKKAFFKEYIRMVNQIDIK